MSTTDRWIGLGGAGLAGILLFAGCEATVGPRDGAVAQAERITALESALADREAALAEARARLEAATEAPPASAEATWWPVPVRILDASGTSARPASHRGPATLQWRLRTEDARGRFVQTIGPAEVVAVALAADGTGVELGRWSIDRTAWVASLREGLLGTAYAIDLVLEEDLPADAAQLLARIRLEDPRCEAPLTLESAIPVVEPLERKDP